MPNHECVDLVRVSFMREVAKILLKSGNLVAIHGVFITTVLAVENNMTFFCCVNNNTGVFALKNT